MKTIAFTIECKPSKYGFNITNRVYKITKNIPVLIGEVTYNTGSFRGHDHEAVAFAVSQKALPKKSVTNSGTQYINFEEKGKSFQVFQL